LSDRPRWLSVCIALAVCITASAAGASLVRSLRTPPAVGDREAHQKPQALAASALPAPLVNTITEKPSEPARPVTSSAPLVVDLESLSVEHKRAAPRAVRVVPKPVPVEPAETSDESTTPANDSAAESPAAETAKNSELPAAARSNPYGSGSLIDQIKKATADEEASQ